ncbi:hypothetical protein CQW23_15989 [Capsicum baccatum]|uniref:Cytochrome f large domain-containing protein n=1 Tax=Capsicum baccatum TaxID=33114 RepID=A0A2G2WNN5_CAPBA|nr:hypothetical protein CQW23_15989 [Capsicum baccatum]
MKSLKEGLQHSKVEHKGYEICEECGCAFRSQTAKAIHQTPDKKLCIASLNKKSGVKLKQWAAMGVRAKNCEMAEDEEFQPLLPLGRVSLLSELAGRGDLFKTWAQELEGRGDLETREILAEIEILGAIERNAVTGGFFGESTPMLQTVKSELNPVALLSFLANNFDLPGQQANDVLILCDNTTERAALLGKQLFDNTTEKETLSCNMLWSQCPYEQDYENPREATWHIVCANCHLANKPVEIEVPQAVLPDTIFEAVVRIPYDMQLK